MESVSDQQPFIYYLLCFYEHLQWMKNALLEYKKNKRETLIWSSRIISRTTLLHLYSHIDALGISLKCSSLAPPSVGVAQARAGNLHVEKTCR